MPKILYSRVIVEDLLQLKKLEKYHRYSHLFQRVRMLRLLKSEECPNLGETARVLGYSWRQCHRWFASYRKGGIEELLKSRVAERGRQELVTPEAFADLEEAMKRGEIATISHADEFLRERHGIEYAHPDGVGQLLRRRKLKTGPAPKEAREGRPQRESRRPSRKLRRRRQPKPRSSSSRAEAAEGFGLRRSSFRAHQLAQETLLSQGVSPTLYREALLQMDLPVRGGRTHDGRELLYVPAGNGRWMPGDIPRQTLQDLP